MRGGEEERAFPDEAAAEPFAREVAAQTVRALRGREIDRVHSREHHAGLTRASIAEVSMSGREDVLRGDTWTDITCHPLVAPHLEEALYARRWRSFNLRALRIASWAHARFLRANPPDGYVPPLLSTNAFRAALRFAELVGGWGYRPGEEFKSDLLHSAGALVLALDDYLADQDVDLARALSIAFNCRSSNTASPVKLLLPDVGEEEDEVARLRALLDSEQRNRATVQQQYRKLDEEMAAVEDQLAGLQKETQPERALAEENRELREKLAAAEETIREWEAAEREEKGR